MVVRYIDLFAGMGGMRLALENALHESGYEAECVLTSEIKPYAVNVYQQNFTEDNLVGDISTVSDKEIPDLDILLAGFPCQPFSSAGTRGGFIDTRGTLFFEIERILDAKRPYAFILENVEGLVNHDRESGSEHKIGRTLRTILEHLENLDYQVTWAVLDSSEFGIPQARKRIYIVGTRTEKVDLTDFPVVPSRLGNILETGQPTLNDDFSQLLLEHYSTDELQGKAIKDKRGGPNNIHSWDIEYKGETTSEQRILLGKLLRQRRRKHWAKEKGIVWMDGMPLTEDEIRTFYKPTMFQDTTLKDMLDDLVNKGYLTYEHPKDRVEKTDKQGRVRRVREYATDKPKGYNIVVGKLSFPITKILDPNDVAPTLVATDVTRLAVTDGAGLRRLTIREGLRLFGYPEDYSMDIPYDDAFDLLGNTVVVPVVEAIAHRLLSVMTTTNARYDARSYAE